ncbi:anti-anti-sigma factor [Neisseria wadsworthii]|uniref:anti-anti-sigma factor n=1 Tax=Neisseria wadsworthii TaxID=607711 RepID=UPI000D31CC06|nr:anti-anti-sigma factor [Neisseria wadsworthii]
MKHPLIPAILLSLLLAACGGNENQPAAPASAPEPATQASAPAADNAASEAADMAEPKASSIAAATPAGELVPLCKEAETLENKYIDTLSGAEKEERIQHRDQWLASLKQATPAEQEENCKQVIEEAKDQDDDKEDKS